MPEIYKYLTFKALILCFTLLLCACSSQDPELLRANRVQEMLHQEEQILSELQASLNKLETGLRNVDPNFAAALFHESLTGKTLLEGKTRSLPSKIALATLDTPKPLESISQIFATCSKLEFLDYASLHVTAIDLLSSDRVITKVTFEAAGPAATKRGGIQATVDIEWLKSSDSWKILKWNETGGQVLTGESFLFRDVLRLVTPNDDSLARLLGSTFYDTILSEDHSNSQTIATYTVGHCYPNSSICDFNQDGWPDIFLSTYGLPNLLLQNNEGIFQDVASDVGLDLEECWQSALFIDTDNDGDQDLLAGGQGVGLSFFVNENGKYRKVCEFSDIRGVCSLSAADYNRDGLLDVYATTASKLKPPPRSGLPRFLDRPGSQNFLLTANGQNEFVLSGSNHPLSVWHQSFQGGWSDYDNDGDQDLYVASDLAPDSLFKNDNYQFVEQTKSFPSEPAFAMGCSWGDYDNDGWQDLYISNMHSNAGLRQVGKGFEEFLPASRGNFLFKNANGQMVEKESITSNAGWSWGSQFVDLNHDGMLDIHTRSGFYTAPPVIAGPGDG